MGPTFDAIKNWTKKDKYGNIICRLISVYDTRETNQIYEWRMN